ncbi:interleukin-1 receptor type 2 [Engraulis encrasicolus]|uniref:interleukin-1 receptor type 2 n=1 Tax=Engraulis encrasicolus TaxID=184585 RepID=UPI002FD4F1C4
MEMLSLLVDPVAPGRDVTLPCYTHTHTHTLNLTHTPRWYKGRSAVPLQVGRGRYVWRRGSALLIRNFASQDSGFYSCRAQVMVFGEHYTVTRYSRVHTKGSSLVLRCTVAMGSQSASSMGVTWLVDGQSIERSLLGTRAFQEHRVWGGRVETDLVILEVREEDSGAELRCVTQTRTGKQEVFVHIEMAEK